MSASPVKKASRLVGRLLATLALLAPVADGFSMRREEVDFDYVAQEAARLATRRYKPSPKIPEKLASLDFDGYQKIRYRQDRQLWRDEGLPFAAGFFHLGYIFQDKVVMNEFTATHVQNVRYLDNLFSFQDEEVGRKLPRDLDYAGVRFLYAESDLAEYREFLSFLGSSYFRAVGKDHHFGTSARGLAINSGLSEPEEFPRFREFWLGKPLGNARSLLFYALLDSPSVTGAYAFVLKPGKNTIVEVKAQLFLREDVKSFGVAPLTSMYWRGENRAARESDFRPEVHDADGLLWQDRGKPLRWRPLDIAQKTRLSYLSTQRLEGFGLLQRDRHFDHYQDMQAEYHKRPSVWIEAKGDWGPGHIKLVELPTDSEFHDNIVAYWEPAVLPEKGSSPIYEYAIHWTGEGNPSDPQKMYVASTRVGEDRSYPGTNVFVLDFVGGSQDRRPTVKAEPHGGAEILETHLIWNPYASAWRVTLRVKRVDDGGDASELECFLLFEDGRRSENWVYQWSR